MPNEPVIAPLVDLYEPNVRPMQDSDAKDPQAGFA
jgi:hypothetical protein